MVSRSRWRWILLAAGAALVVGAALLAVRPYLRSTVRSDGQDHTAARADPRLTYSGPYLNIHPDVKYVGDAACAECHAEHADSYRKHPMGRSLLSAATEPDLLLGAAHHNPFHALGSEFRVEKRGDTYVQRETRLDDAGKPIYTNEMETQYLIGSGNHAHSFLCVRNGYVWQAPLSWYSAKKIWDISPGWTLVSAGKPVQVDCLFCHANHVEAEPGYLNRYREPLFDNLPIGCERCHGPGEKHVAAWSEPGRAPVGPDYTIVNPGKLPTALREAVCHQCHLEGEFRLLRRGRRAFDFRPGMPFEEFWSVFVNAEQDHNRKAVTHVEQMHQSRCFRASTGNSQMGCLSCHDPHVKVLASERASYFREKCLHCHATRGCSVPEPDRRKTSPSDSCIECHMQPFTTSDVAHVAGTDHRILRRPESADPTQRRQLSSDGGSPIRLFQKPRTSDYTDEEQRDLGIALAQLASEGKIPSQYVPEALRYLDAAVQHRPADAAAWDAKATALEARGRRAEALAARETAVACQPNREVYLARAAMLAGSLERLELSLDYWKRAVEMNQWQPSYHANIAVISLRRNDLQTARKHADVWLRLDPGNLDARVFWVEYWLQAGNKDKAREAFAAVQALKPPNMRELGAIFERRLAP